MADEEPTVAPEEPTVAPRLQKLIRSTFAAAGETQAALATKPATIRRRMVSLPVFGATGQS